MEAVGQRRTVSSDLVTARDRWAVGTIARQRCTVEEWIDHARSVPADDKVTSCRWWLAVERQIHRYLRNLDPWVEMGGFRRSLPAIPEYRESLRREQRRARVQIDGHAEAAQRQASTQLGVRIAVMGKGGVGKTVIASTLARVLARRGRNVLAADLDTSPGLAISLGMSADEGALPPDAVEVHPGANYGWQLANTLTPLDAVARYAAPAPDGVHLLAVGKIGSADKLAAKRSVAAMVQILLGLGSPEWDVVADLEAGPTTPFERYHSFADDVVVVVGPSSQSALAAKRLFPMVGERNTVVVASGLSGEANQPGLSPRVRVPFDPCVALAERAGHSALDRCPGGPATDAVAQLAELWLHREVTA